MFIRPRNRFSAVRPRGVALLVTIILLSFLVLLMVALSSLVRVETKITGNNVALDRARQNALMGLNVALGKLQETAGPDQRVTARADVIEPSFTKKYQMNLTGVWDTSGSGAPKLVSWLVNGNEDLDGNAPNLDPDGSASANKTQATTLLLNAGDDANSNFGNPSTSPLFDDVYPPAHTFNPVSGAPDFQFGDGHVYLVGNGSVDVSNTENNTISGKSYKHAISERVIVRKTPITVDGAKLPGKASGSDVIIGHYAYWVGDAGVKASMGAANQTADLKYDDSSVAGDGADYEGGTSANQADFVNRKMINSLQLQGARPDLLLRPSYDATGGALIDDIFVMDKAPSYLNITPLNVDRRVIYGVVMHPKVSDRYTTFFSLNQIQDFLSGDSFSAGPQLGGVQPVPSSANSLNAFRTVIATRMKQLYHDVTPQTYSVMTNMLTGGLRTDISATAGRDTMPATLRAGVEQFTDVWRPKKGLSTTTNVGFLRQQLSTDSAHASPAPNTTDSAYPIAPVITEFELTVDPDLAATGAVSFALSGRVELWNPYAAELKISKALQIGVSVKDTNGNATKIIDDMSTPLECSLEHSLAALVHANLVPANTILNAGQVKVFTFTVPSVAARDSLDNALAFAPTSTSADFQAFDTAKLSVELLESNGATTDPVSQFNSITLLAGAGPQAQAYLHFRLKDWVNVSNEKDWLAFDPRGPVYAQAAVLPGMLGTTTSFFAANPADDLYDASRAIRLFDVPRQEVLSVGSLRHIVYNTSSGLYAIGRENQGTRNDVFEEYFFSSVPRDKAAGWSPKAGLPLANGSITIIDPDPRQSTSENEFWTGRSPLAGTDMNGLQSKDAAQYILVKDTLNVNSTSPVAWRSLLGGALPALADPNDGDAIDTDFTDSTSQDYVWRRAGPAAEDVLNIWANWRYYNGSKAQSVPVRNAFFRFPHAATNLGEDYVALRKNLAAPAGRTAWPTLGARAEIAFKLGLREISSAQVDELAWRVAYLVKNPPSPNDRPFKSLTQFVNEGLLQKAIDEVGNGSLYPGPPNDPINNPGKISLSLPVNSPKLPLGSPAFITQGDILELISHRLVARSDTFVIRAYGDVNDPDAAGAGRAKILSRVWVEATVQRMPMKHPTAKDPDENMKSTDTGVGNLGRQFRIINLRWLRPEEV
jgi:hypothetical protein